MTDTVSQDDTRPGQTSIMGIGHFLVVTTAALLVLSIGLFDLIALARQDAERSRRI
jgi:hypothetical protein